LPWNASRKAYGLYLAIAASTVAVLLLDLSSKTGLAVGMLYVIPVTLTLWTKNWRFPIYLTLVLTPLMVFGWFLKPPGYLDAAVVNRPLSIVMVYIVSFLCALQLWAVAERRKVEENVESSEEKYRTIFETLNEGIMTSDIKGNITLANRAVVEMLGYSAEKELQGKPALQIYPDPEIRTRFTELLRREGRFRNLEVDFKKADGSLVPVLLSGILQKDKEGKWAGFLGIFRDMTEMKKVQEEIRKAAAYNRSLFEASLDPMIAISPEGIITDVNSAMENATGVDRSEMVGFPFENYIAQKALAIKGYQAAFKEGSLSNYELELLNRSGGRTPFMFNASVYRDGGGEVVGIIFTARDITEIRSYEEELRRHRDHLEELVEERAAELRMANEELQEKTEDLTRSNEELEQFAYVASHDLQEPLRMISSYLQLLDRRYKGKLDKDADEFIFYAVDGANRLQTMINDLLQYSRVETRGKTFTAVDMNTVMGVVLNNLKVAIEESGGVVLSDPLPTVLADEAQMIMLLQNLVGNAIKYRRPDEKLLVSVSAVSSGQEWIFAVKDNGIGIDPAYHDRIFRIFQRLNPRSEYEGTGIGLAIAKRIVDRHRGRIWLESELGKGSTFFFSIMKTGGK